LPEAPEHVEHTYRVTEAEAAFMRAFTDCLLYGPHDPDSEAEKRLTAAATKYQEALTQGPPGYERGLAVQQARLAFMWAREALRTRTVEEEYLLRTRVSQYASEARLWACEPVPPEIEVEVPHAPVV
jgi:hypothetical protein